MLPPFVPDICAVLCVLLCLLFSLAMRTSAALCGGAKCVYVWSMAAGWCRWEELEEGSPAHVHACRWEGLELEEGRSWSKHRLLVAMDVQSPL